MSFDKLYFERLKSTLQKKEAGVYPVTGITSTNSDKLVYHLKLYIDWYRVEAPKDFPDVDFNEKYTHYKIYNL